MLKFQIEGLYKRFGGSSQFKNFISLFEIALYLLSFVSFIYLIVFGPRIKTIKCLIIIFLLLGYRFIPSFFNINLHDILKLSVLIFIFMSMFLAEILNFYTKIPFYDKILHLISGIMLFFLGQALYKRIESKQNEFQTNTTIMVLFSMFFSIAMAGCWEIFEFSCDRIFGYHLQLDSLFDTMGDIICGTTTAVLTAIFVLSSYRAKKVNIADSHLVDEIRDDYSEMVSVKD